MTEQQPSSFLSVGFNTKLSLPRTTLFGLQHLTALAGIWLVPGIIGGALQMEIRDIAWMIQGCLLLTGVVTILQSSRVLRLPIVQGPSVAFMALIIAIGQSGDLSTAFGSMAVAGVLFALLCLPMKWVGLFGYLAPLISKPIVFGTFFVIVGAQLASYGVGAWFGTPGQEGYGGEIFLISLSTFLAVVALTVFGGTGIVGRTAVLLGTVIGSALAIILGLWSVPSTAGTPIVGTPEWMPFGFHVSPDAVVLMFGAYLMSATEAVGMYEMVSRWGGEKVDAVRANRGLFAEMIGTAIGTLFGGVGSTSYPENAGIVRISRVGSRYVTMTAGIIAVVLAFIPKISLLAASIPSYVIFAAATVLYGVIAFSGVQILRDVDWNDQLNLMVAGPALILALGVPYIPSDIVDQLPDVLANLVTIPMMVGVFWLVVFNGAVNLLLRPWVERRRSTVAIVADVDAV